jgi:hypothetical protein
VDWRYRFYVKGKCLYYSYLYKLELSFFERLYMRLWAWVYGRPLL